MDVVSPNFFDLDCKVKMEVFIRIKLRPLRVIFLHKSIIRWYIIDMVGKIFLFIFLTALGK